MNILPLTNANLSEGSISLLYTKTNEEKNIQEFLCYLLSL